jgi:membrane protease YdiL (CAAX protease family)
LSSDSGWRTFLGPVALLILSYFIYFVRRPLWQTFAFVEPLFTMLILSYFALLVFSLLLLKRDFEKSSSEIFKTHGCSIVLKSVALALVFQALWFLFSLGLGSGVTFTSFPSLSAYEGYVVRSLSVGFALYLTFTVFGAFTEEVAYRSYVQSRIQARYGYLVGIFFASLLFSLQHIHVFQPSWIERFFQTQFVYVLLFGVFVGYLFLRSKGDVWSVFAFHATMNICNITLPLEITPAFSYANHLAAILSFLSLFLLLRFGLKGRRTVAPSRAIHRTSS